MKKNFEVNLNIYPVDIITQAIGDFSDIGQIDLDEGTLTISGNSDDEIEEIFNELMNYVIGLVNEY